MMQFSCRLKESNTDKAKDGNRFRVILLSEGLGNFGNCYYYTPECLKSAIEIFEGAQSYANHPSSEEEVTRPERDVKDLIGHFENVEVEKDGDHSVLCGDYCIVEGTDTDWARNRLKHALEYSKKYADKDFIGLSINASGDCEEVSIDEMISSAPESRKEKLLQAKENGTKTVRKTTSITSCQSCDLVTVAGAGGRATEILETSKETTMPFPPAKADPKADPKAAPVATDAAPKADAAPAAHDDKAQDIELIKSMLAKHGVDNADESEASKIHGAYMKMGLKQDEAAEACAKHMKASKIMQDEAVEAEKTEGEKEVEAETEESEETDEAKKESNKVATLAGKVAMLEAELAKRNLESHIEKTLEASKLSRSATKIFKENYVSFKNKESFDSAFKSFKAVVDASGSKTNNINMEKTDYRESNTNTVSFKGAVKN